MADTEYPIALSHRVISTMPQFIMINDPNSKENVEKYEKFQKWVFGATFMNYAMAHWTRK